MWRGAGAGIIRAMLDTYLNELDAALPSLLGEGGAPVAALTRHRLLDKPHGDLPRWHDAVAASCRWRCTARSTERERQSPSTHSMQRSTTAGPSWSLALRSRNAVRKPSSTTG